MQQSLTCKGLCAGAGVSSDACSLWSHGRHAGGRQCLQGRRPSGHRRPGSHGHHIRLRARLCQQHIWPRTLSLVRMRLSCPALTSLVEVPGVTKAPHGSGQLVHAKLKESRDSHVHLSLNRSGVASSGAHPYQNSLSAMRLIVSPSFLQNAGRSDISAVSHSRGVSLQVLAAEVHSTIVTLLLDLV